MLLNFVNNNDIVNTNTDKINGSLTENRCSIVDIARKHDGDDVDLLNGAVDETINKSQESSDNLLIDINDTTKIDSPVLIDIKISTPEETSTIDAEQHNLKIDPELSECMSNKQLIEGDSNVSKSFSLNDPVIPVFKDPLPPASDDFDTWTTVAEATTEDVVETKPEEVDTSPVIVEDLEIKKSEDLEIKESEDLENQKSEDQELVVVESVTTTKKTEFETKSSIIEAVSCTREIVIIEQTSTTNGPISEETITDEADASSVSVQHVVCETVVGSNKSKDVTESSESVITEKKTVKKKKSSEGGETTATKTKKTKKTKKSEEKENHISVRRSFGDLHKACENAELTTPEPPAINNSQKARSLGDLRRLSEVPAKLSIHTGVSVKALKSSFSKFDQLQKKTLLHVRSSDSSRAQKTFGGAGEPAASPTVNPPCKSCGKTVFAMEQVKAERSVWHKNCFRCQECNKQLTLDIYSSHEGVLYCKPHFRELFKPKAVVENEDEPASDKPDLGLEELNSLNVKSRFQAFEKPTTENGHDSQPSSVNVKRSPSILSKLAKFQKKGMDIGVTDESLNGIDYEESSSSGEEEDGKTAVRKDGVVRSTKAIERPTAFGKMEDVKRSWESGQAQTKEEWLEERKREKHSIRSRLFMGKQGKMKEMYEQAVAESEGGKGSSGLSKKEVESLRSDKARTVREKFERGEVVHSDSDEESDKHKHNGTEDMSVFEEGISKKSRSLFLEMDANVAKTKQSTPVPTPQPVQHQNSLEATRRARDVYISRGQVSTEDVVKSSDRVEDVTVQTADVSNKFKFFETYKPPEKEKKSFRFTPPREGQVKTESPDREIYRDPNVVRSDDPVAEDEAVVKRSQTTSKMLSIFRQMEEAREPVPEGLKPLKRFTPPPDYKEDEDDEEEEEEEEEESEEEEEEESEEEENNGIVRASDKIEDEFLKQAQNAARAKSLKEKFEHWEPEKQSKNNAINMLDSDQASLDSTKSLRAHFESLKSEQPKEKSRPKVNRFVDPAQSMSVCAACDTKVYILERVETNGKVFHKKCFRCTQCSCVLRMETYTLNNGQLYCLPHFKQLFIVKGNYDEGFGSDQHKRKWEATIVNGSH
ncbi:protein-methionine sulfoxide oxidase mical3a isoform X22 [Nilaparvata lugens]|uniref:protein-methionine sulfoxide oxidase mical3a isoform X22 n=1 Tax=Nilaparvata lugens TaxID=108931 RepID=UPI00193E086D|nr:protein-methionine sulfoxide oxidase mical3a isoform X22 [Nilaparvata lugens]